MPWKRWKWTSSGCLRDSSQQRAGAIGAVVPGVWDFAPDGILLAASIPAGAATAKSAAYRCGATRARRGASPRDGSGRQEVADCFARGRWRSTFDPHHLSDSGAAWLISDVHGSARQRRSCTARKGGRRGCCIRLLWGEASQRARSHPAPSDFTLRIQGKRVSGAITL